MVYILLTVTGLAGAAIALFKSDHRSDAAILFIVSASWVMLADWIAFGWFALYDYRPYLVANPVADGALGELLADILFVPALCVTLLRFLPGLGGIAVGTAIVTTIEALFLTMGLFHHHGWTLWHTAFGFVIYFAALDLFWHDLRGGVLPPVHLRAILRVSLIFDLIAILTLFLRANRWVVTNIQIVPSYLGNQSLGRFIFYGLVVVPPAYWAMSGERRWLRLAALSTGIMLLNYLLTAFGIQRFVPPWSGPVDALAQGAAVALAGLLESLISNARTDQRVRRST